MIGLRLTITQDVEGRVKGLDSFRELDPLTRADVLRDWLHELELEYHTALEQMFEPAKIHELRHLN